MTAKLLVPSLALASQGTQTMGEKRMVRKPATKSAKLRKKMDQRKARAKPVKKTKK
jgi:hypothetical protein